MKKYFLLSVFLFVFVLSAIRYPLNANLYAQESVQILTYYPAPYGVYENMKVTQQVYIGHDINDLPLQTDGTSLLQVGGTTSAYCAIYGANDGVTDGYGVYGFTPATNGSAVMALHQRAQALQARPNLLLTRVDILLILVQAQP